jgi:hypothetical protein
MKAAVAVFGLICGIIFGFVLVSAAGFALSNFRF